MQATAAVIDRPSAEFEPALQPFKTLMNEPGLRDALDQRGYQVTTPLHSAVLCYAQDGKDVIGCAETGTGKTAAYVNPVIARLIRQDLSAGPKRSHHSTPVLN